MEMGHGHSIQLGFDVWPLLPSSLGGQNEWDWQGYDGD